MKRSLLSVLMGLVVLLLSSTEGWSAGLEKGTDAYAKGDYATALREWNPLAEQGHAFAQNSLGWMYAIGKGVPQNFKTAVKWFRLAAEQGYPLAQRHLGYMYANGQGVPQNDVTALKWYTRAADQGDSTAKRNIKNLEKKIAEQKPSPTVTAKKTTTYNPNPEHLKSLKETNKCIKCDLQGANLQGAELEGANLEEAKLQGANLEGANLEGANLRRADLRGAKLQGAYLDGADLMSANLRNAHLYVAKLQGASLNFAKLQEANLSGANLKGALLWEANLNGADLERAYLNKADLMSANLKGANLEEAKLQGANLNGANLNGANLRNARLYRARLQGTNLEGANLKGARLDPEGIQIAKATGAINIPEPAGVVKKTPKVTPKKTEPESPAQSISASGFFVSRLGHVITNEHIVRNCKSVTVGDNANKQSPANIEETDKRNDLALLKLSTLTMASAETQSLIAKLGIKVVPLASDGLLRSEDVELGEKIMVSGYPYGDIFSNTIKVTGGMVSAVRGMGDDSSQFTMDAAVQKGSSGGPIYDENGNVVGVVVAKLDRAKVAKRIGSMPENMNFGIKASTVRQFLTSSGLPTKWSTRSKSMSTKELAKIAQKQTLMVMCHQ